MDTQGQLLELLRRKREELVARHAAVLQEVQQGQQQVVALAGAIAGVDEMIAETEMAAADAVAEPQPAEE